MCKKHYSYYWCRYMYHLYHFRFDSAKLYQKNDGLKNWRVYTKKALWTKEIDGINSNFFAKVDKMFLQT